MLTFKDFGDIAEVFNKPCECCSVPPSFTPLKPFRASEDGKRVYCEDCFDQIPFLETGKTFLFPAAHPHYFDTVEV